MHSHNEEVDSHVADHNDIKIIIRDARKEDAKEIATLLGELQYPATIEFAVTKIRQLSGRRRDRILIAEKESRIVGVLSLHIMPLLHKQGDLCRVSALIVAEGYRRQYIGRRLMEMAEAYAKANDCFRIEVTSGDHRNDAHQFYDHLGYREVSRRFVKDIEKP